MPWLYFFESAHISQCWAWFLTLWQGMALLVWLWQKRKGALGGPISAPKACWLVFVIGLWFFVPLALWDYGQYWHSLALSMWARGLLEIHLCARGKWQTSYGIRHDEFHGVLAGIALFSGEMPPFWFGLTFLTMAVEIHFVRCFEKATAGPASGIFFVPGRAEFRRINFRTILALAFCYPLFFYALWWA